MITRYSWGVLSYVVILIIIFLLVCLYHFGKKAISFRQKKSYSIKIPVNLEKCEVITFDFARHGILSDEIHPFGTDNNVELNDYTADSGSKKALYIKFESENKKFFAGPIYKDETTIQVWFAEKKSTYVYLDEITQKYFFDLTFLYE